MPQLLHGFLDSTSEVLRSSLDTASEIRNFAHIRASHLQCRQQQLRPEAGTGWSHLRGLAIQKFLQN